MIEQKKEVFVPFIETIDHVPVLVQNERGDYSSLEEYLNAPTRTHIDETLRTFPSWIETLKDRLDPEQATVYTNFYDRGKFDTFGFNARALDCRVGPQWRNDVMFYWTGVYMKDFRDWLAHDEKPLSQEEFALFLEKKLHNVKTDPESGLRLPSQMELYNFVTNLQDSNKATFARKVNMQNGNVSVTIEKVMEDGHKDELKTFERFSVFLQPYEGFPYYYLTVRLRFRIREGQVIFFYDIEGLEEMFINARQWALNEIVTKTGIRVCE